MEKPIYFTVTRRRQKVTDQVFNEPETIVFWSPCPDRFELNLTYLQSMNIFKLFGPEKPKYDPYWEFNKEIHFRPKLNKADYYKLSGFDFGWFVLEPISNFINKVDYELERSKSLSYSQKALYFWWYVDAQVNNGGFVQFYYNDYGKYVPTIIKGLEWIGDKKMADLIQKAENIYQKRKKLIERARQDDLFGSDLYEKLEELGALDDEYYALNKETMSKIEKYIRQHPEEICVDEEGKEFDKTFSGECKSYYPNGKVKAKFQIENGSINGEFKSFYENEGIQELILYKDGEPTGEKTEFFENGNKKYSVKKNLSENQFEHFWQHENGNPKRLEHRQIDNEERIGEFKEWHDNGQLAKSCIYSSGHEWKGPWLEFYSNGRKKLEAEWSDGEFLVHSCWNENGEQTLRNGTGIYVHDYNGWEGYSTHSEDEYMNYKRHGKQLTYTNGVLSLYQEMENGKEHGITRTYYKSGNIQEESVYKKGELVSSKKFPKFKNPRVDVKIKTQLCENCYPDEDNLQPPDNEPNPLNTDELEREFIADKALFEPYGDDHTLFYNYTVKTNKVGEVIEIRFLSADNMWIDRDIQASIGKLRFEIAYKNNQPTECYFIVQHLLSLAE